MLNCRLTLISAVSTDPDGNGAVWTGGQRIDPVANSSFVWKTGGYTLYMNYTAWMTGKPDYNTWVDGCVVMVQNRTFKWDDIPCTHIHRYICEVD